MQQLLSVLHGLAEQLQRKCVARQLANIVWSCGHLGTVDTAAVLLPVFLRDRNLQQADQQGMSNVLWAAATLKLLHLAVLPLQYTHARCGFDKQTVPAVQVQQYRHTITAMHATMGAIQGGRLQCHPAT